jgi:peroxiredoxin family protein
MVLCEKAEELLLETNIMNAFKALQELHERWREIGPVPADMRTEMWERFKEATSKINKKHQEYFVNLKSEQKKNLEAKVILCEKAEELCNQEIRSNRDWTRLSNEMMELQKVWKTMGYAPKKDNNKIYMRFRNACDAFFNKKREFYSIVKEEQDNNLQLKTDLCMQAEAIQGSSEWKKTTEELIALQQRWKEIGPVPFKVSDKIWKRFRTACDAFFERKSKHYAEVDDSFESNLQKKKDLIQEIEGFLITDNAEESLTKLKEFQRQWAEIGFVPLKDKEEIIDKYRAVINKKFDELQIDEERKSLFKFKTKLENIMDKANGDQRIRQEREKYITKLRQLESEIVLWENNIGFFTKSKNAESMIKEVELKIENAKSSIILLKKKIGMIDDIED